MSSLTRAPGIAEQDEFAVGARLLASLRVHTHLEPVESDWGRGRRGDEDGGTLRVQVVQVDVSFPLGGGNLTGEGDRHYHIQAA